VPPIIWPAGAVELSLDDYARFLQLNLRGLQGRDTTLLRAETIKRLHTSPVTPGDNFAHGWGVQEFDGAPARAHVGSAGAFYCVAILQPTRDLAVAVFANAGGERADKATKEALKALVRRYATSAAK
jgi:CubicO group peptidase (beta-lactamase class C family)